MLRRAVLRGRVPASVAAEPHDDDLLHAVHDPAMTRWLRAGLGPLGRGRVRPRPGPGPRRAVPVRDAVDAATGCRSASRSAVHARAGRYCYDTMTLIGPGTWEAARAAVDVAATAADLAWADGGRDLRAVPPAGPPRDPLGLRRVLLPEQRRRRGRAAAPAGRRVGSRSSTWTPTTATGRRRSSTTAPTCSTPPARRPGRRLVPARRRFADETRRGRGSGRQPQPCRWRQAPATRAGWPPYARSVLP